MVGGTVPVTRIATVDVGTNTALLLVADIAANQMVPVYEEQRFVRLGEGVDSTKRISAAAMERLREALLVYRAVAEEMGTQQIIIAATSASRDAANKAAIIDFVRRETGLSYEILSGDEEAQWSFAGAISAFEDLEGMCAVIDIGGGSTEIIIGEPAGAITYRRSIDIGAIRLTERFFSRQPPVPQEIEQAATYVENRLIEADIPLNKETALIGAAGTILALAHVDGASQHTLETGAVVLPCTTIRAWRDRLLGASFDEVLALNPEVLQGRADVFHAGVLILDAVMHRYGLPACCVSPHGLRHGLALREIARAYL